MPHCIRAPARTRLRRPTFMKKGERPGIHDPEAKTKEVNMPKNLLRAILARTLKLLLKCLCVILLLFWAPNAF